MCINMLRSSRSSLHALKEGETKNWASERHLNLEAKSLSKKFCDLKTSDPARLPGLTFDHSRFGTEII